MVAFLKLYGLSAKRLACEEERVLRGYSELAKVSRGLHSSSIARDEACRISELGMVVTWPWGKHSTHRLTRTCIIHIYIDI